MTAEAMVAYVAVLMLGVFGVLFVLQLRARRHRRAVGGVYCRACQSWHSKPH